MKKIFTFISLLRPLNLLIIAYCLALAQYAVLEPNLTYFQLLPSLSFVKFQLLVLATLLVASAGYMINDLYDIEADKINQAKRSQKVLLLGEVRLKNSYHLFNICALLLLVIFLRKEVSIFALMVFPATILLLNLYARKLQHIVLLGNFTVAFLTAIVVLMPAICEMSLWAPYSPTEAFDKTIVWRILLFYAGFAFLISMSREIIKDIQDEEGDRKAGAKTLAILIGPSKARFVAAVFVVLTFVLISFLQKMSGKDNLYYYFTLGLQLLMVLTLVFTAIANNATRISRLSTWYKLLMFLGLSSMILYYHVYFSSFN